MEKVLRQFGQDQWKEKASSSAFQHILEELENSCLSPQELYHFFNQMAMEYCATDDFCESAQREQKKEAIKVIGRILYDLKNVNAETQQNPTISNL